jgi:molecular chaperone GrpE
MTDEGVQPPPSEAQVADLKERLARARADYDNLQKRVARDAAAEQERLKARVLEGFLPLLELAHMAAQQAERHPGPLSEGIILLAREFDRLAEREGLQRVGTVGEKADPARHEVVAAEPAEGVEAGCISRVVQPGYLLGGRVLRYAKVCVAPTPGDGPAASG